jgi:hypothetical protein
MLRFQLWQLLLRQWLVVSTKPPSVMYAPAYIVAAARPIHIAVPAALPTTAAVELNLCLSPRSPPSRPPAVPSPRSFPPTDHAAVQQTTRARTPLSGTAAASMAGGESSISFSSRLSSTMLLTLESGSGSAINYCSTGCNAAFGTCSASVVSSLLSSSSFPALASTKSTQTKTSNTPLRT